MEDVAPGLLKAIREDFARRIAESEELQRVYRKITEGNAAYADAQEYAELLGEDLSKSFLAHFSSDSLPDGRLYYNIADRVIRPMLKEDYSLISDAAAAVQQSLNKKAGISIKPQRPPVNEDRVEGIVSKVSDAESFDDTAWVLEEPVVNYSKSVVDDTIRANADFHYKVGLTPKIQRMAEAKACKWCRSLEGTYEYPDVPRDVYRRHERCRCIVEYDPGSGKRQNVHTKQWTDDTDHDMMEKRKSIGLEKPITHEFRNRKLLAAHYDKHSSEFGTISITSYLRKANELADAQETEDVAQLRREDGVAVKYRFSTNEFIAINQDGTIRTFFKPEQGKEYWKHELQKGRGD